MADAVERLRWISTVLGREVEMLELEDKIQMQVRQEIDQSQREYYLREQLRAIQHELGETDIFQQDLQDVRSGPRRPLSPGAREDRARTGAACHAAADGAGSRRGADVP